MRKETSKERGGENKPRVVIRKVKDKHAGHHGGAWKVAYADFVTAMMALFIVLWIIATADPDLKAGLAQYFRNPGVFEATAGSLLEGQQGLLFSLAASHAEEDSESPRVLEQLEERLKEALRSLEEYPAIQDQISIRLTPEGLLVDMVDKDKQAFFDLGSAELRTVLRHILEKIVQQVGNLPNKITVGGHTDARQYPDSSFYSNWELSATRALNARRAMEEMGLPPARVEQVTGYADSTLLFPRDPLNPANRRISILILPN
jgi:chemotaxis protein MotB